MVVDVYPSAVADHDEGGVELSDLIQQEVLYDEPDEVTLVVLDILLTLEHLRELLAQHRHAQRKHVDVLVEVLPSFVVLHVV